MSTLRASNIYDKDGTNTARLYGVSMRDGGTGWVNRIINGAMTIDQRNAGASVTNGFAVDRFEFQENSGSAYTIQRSTTAPAGFTNSLLVTVTTAASATAAQVNRLFQRIEGNNIADLGWGTANAQTVTLSFRVRSSLTGTYCIGLVNDAANRSYVAEYTISAANTWETKTITIAGDTSGTWETGTASGIQVTFDLGGGSNYNTTAGAWAAGNYTRTTNQANFANTNGATFYITGVQLEAGSVASPFERRDYGRELMMCQRYYYRISAANGSSTYTKYGIGFARSSTRYDMMLNTPVTMRAAPTSLDTSAANTFLVYDGGSDLSVSGLAFDQQNLNTIVLNITVSGATQYRSGNLQANNNTTSYLGLGAEL
jgi:hypothetical protein